MATADDQHVRLAIPKGDLGLPLVEPVRIGEIAGMRYRAAFFDLMSQIRLKSSDVDIVQATGSACDGLISLIAPVPGPFVVSKEMIASTTSRPATVARRGARAAVSSRKPPARTSAARRLSSRHSISLPLKVASCQDIPNRLRQWLSGRTIRPRLYRRRLRARGQRRAPIGRRFLRPKVATFPASTRFPA
jgi:hypothetical protein